MRIGLVYQRFVSQGGLEGYLFALSKALLEAGHQLHVLTGKTDPATDALGLPTTRVDLPRSKTRALLAFERAARALAPDLPTEVTLGFGRTSRQDLHRAGAGCHAAYVPLLHPLKRLGFKSRVELALERDLYTGGATRGFVVNSALVRDQLIEHYAVPEERFSIIHTAVDTATFRPAADAGARRDLRVRLGLDDDRPAVLFLSRAHRRKGLPALLAAWPEIHDRTGAQLWVAGPDPARFLRSLPSKYAPTVTHHGETSAVVALYQAADLFVHPTLYDACANTVLQSMACGLPGLISSADGAREFVEPGANGWLLDDPASTEEIAEKTVAALGADRLATGAAARERVLPLTWDAHVAAWERAIASLPR